MAYNVSNAGGGDAGSWGAVMNALAMWRALDDDISDGCFDGYDGATQLFFGTASLTLFCARLFIGLAFLSFVRLNQF